MKTEILADFQICIDVPFNIFYFKNSTDLSKSVSKGTFKIKAISP